MENISVKRVKEIKEVILTDCILTLEEFIAVVKYEAKIKLSESFKTTVNKSRELVDKFLKEERIIYGVTTGFGQNVKYTISANDAITLQKNIIRSHACSVGEPLKKEQIRAILLMIILNTGKGFSGIKLDTLNLIKEFLNNNIIPFAPGSGSVGYLVVEAHIALTLMGEGSILVEGKKTDTMDVLNRNNLKTIEFGAKEGLCLISGTTSATALGLLALYESIVAMKNIELAGALVYEALRGTTKALDMRIHKVKKHEEQINCAINLTKMLQGSEICEKYFATKVQDSCSLRAMPQIEGAVKRLIKEAYEVIIEEMNSVSDNPQICKTEDNDGIALMTGNFDGTYVGSHADMLSMAGAIIGNLVERCTDRMINSNLNDGLPAFLVTNPGLNNGFMIPQYTLAGLLSEIKILATPATIDSISTCANQEDPVSLAYNASKKAGDIADKLQYMVAVEIMTALQAIDLLKPLNPSPVNKKVRDFIREKVEFLDKDRYIYSDIEYMYEFVKEMDLIEIVEKEIGELLF